MIRAFAILGFLFSHLYALTQKTYVITHVRIIPMNVEKALEHQTVVISNGKILKVSGKRK